MRTVYRVQNAEGQGPYTTGNWWLNDAHKGPAYPTPHRDSIILHGDIRFLEDAFSRGYICGFSTMEKLMEWFSNDELERLKLEGFDIAEVEAEDVLLGNRQIIFKRKAN